jgi:hypothetical protein
MKKKDPSKVYYPGEKIASGTKDADKHPQVWPARKDTGMKNIYIKHSVGHEKTNKKETVKQKMPINMNHSA